MTQGRYRISFTSGSLYHRESVKLADLYLSLRDWEEVRAQALHDNLLQARTESTAKRTCREAIARLKTLAESELTFLAEANHQDQAHTLLLVISNGVTCMTAPNQDLLSWGLKRARSARSTGSSGTSR
ncbi:MULTISPECIES: BrxA family protein [Halomonadaceae]|uniref:BrxA family protein n=1 Tax=Halomonadaceae TaxID=28256 RepID=UPI001F0721F4|nr:MULTISPECIES: BrxA family protein [Halomonas]